MMLRFLFRLTISSLSSGAALTALLITLLGYRFRTRPGAKNGSQARLPN